MSTIVQHKQRVVNPHTPKSTTQADIDPDRLAQCLTAALRILRNDKTITVRRVITEPKNGEVAA